VDQSIRGTTDAMVKIYPIDSFGLVYREVIASSCLVTLASLALFMRLAARWIKKIPLWWDDFTVFIVWVRHFFFSFLSTEHGRASVAPSGFSHLTTKTVDSLGDVCYSNKV
jgi:hypothetical protein